VSDTTYCKQCGVNDGDEAKCDGCDLMFPHDFLVHYDGAGAFCQDCDEWVEVEEEEEQS